MLEAAVNLTGQSVADTGRTAGVLPVEISDLVFEAGGKRLIDGLNLQLAAGPRTIIMGPNGAGKSLLLRLLHGMISPTSGDIRWCGMPLSEDIRKRQAMVFQSPVLLRRSVAANVDFVLKLRGKDSATRRLEILDHVGLSGHADQAARLLSGGEQQRLALARALALDPEVLFLDEPTVSLDPASVQMIEDIIQAAHRRGTKIIFVTHDIGQAKRLGDEIVFVHRGRVLEQTPASRFFDAPDSEQARDYLAGRIIL